MQYRGAGYENLIVYGYDKNGNITKAGDVTYAYDEAGQLTRVNDPRYGTTVYTYDVGGNIKYVKTYDYTTGELGAVKSTGTYSYDSVWKDKLISYNGQAITYDGAGNPLTYRNGISFTWEMGRQLAGLSTENKTYTYQYNADGLRIQTSDGTTTTRYTWVDGRLTSQTNGTDTLYFRYDENGNPLAVLYNGTEYYYVTNLQGDIIALLDGQGNCVVEYTYDAWGKVLSKTGSMATSLGSDNPLRYRGYYYDSETGFYYLQSRYYDPATGRFINADNVSYLGVSGTTLSYNLFAYCENNPVNYLDYSGFLAKYALALAGKTFLALRGYSISADMWWHGFYGNGKRYISSKLYQSIIKSGEVNYQINTEVNKYLRQYGKNQNFWKNSTITVQYKSGDLLYAVKKMKLELTISYRSYHRPQSSKKAKGQIIVSYRVSDTYDFTELLNYKSFANIANNMGYYLVKYNWIKVYSWYYDYSYYYEVY